MVLDGTQKISKRLLAMFVCFNGLQQLNNQVTFSQLNNACTLIYCAIVKSHLLRDNVNHGTLICEALLWLIILHDCEVFANIYIT